MNEAPERIWFDRNMRFDHQAPILYQSDREDDDIEYVRADLARLPEDLVERARVAVEWDLHEQFDGALVRRVLAEILVWHEQQEGG